VTGSLTVNGEPITSQPFVPFKSQIVFNGIIKNLFPASVTSLMNWTLTGSPTYVTLNLTNLSITYNFPDASPGIATTLTFFIDSNPTTNYQAINQELFSVIIPANNKVQGQNYTFSNFNNTIALSATAQSALENYNTLYLKCYMTQPGTQTTPIEFSNILGSATINAYKVGVPTSISPSL